MHLAAAIQGIDYSGVYCQDAQVLAEAQINFAETFAIDHVHVSTDAYREASAWGVEIDFSGHTPIAKTHLNLEDFESIEEPDLSAAVRIQDRIKAVRLLRDRARTKQCVIGWIEAPFAEICCLFGMMDVLKMARHQDWNDRVKTLFKRILPVQLELAKMQIEAGADIIGAGDSAVSQIGPKRYQEACLDFTRELFSGISKHVPVLYHVCGDSSVVDGEGRDMLYLVAESGASILDLDYQVGMASAKEKVGNRLCIRGNTNTSMLGSRIYGPYEVAEVVTKTIEEGKPGGKYMFAAGCEWPWEPLDLAIRNLEIAKTLVEKLGGY
jgi:uroporphyrinogen-III decarboxylase